MKIFCQKCQSILVEDSASFSCPICFSQYLKKEGIASFIKEDRYWGEFSEAKMDELLNLTKTTDWAGVVKFIDKELKRRDFIFGKARTDFLYMFNLNKEMVCLDAACGLGVNSFNLAPYVGQVYSFDQSLKRVSFCHYRQKIEQVNNLNVFHADFNNLPFPENFFDIIVMNGVVEWLGEINKNKDPRLDQVEILNKLYRLLKPGGQLYVGIENRFSLAYLKGRDHNGLYLTSYLPRFLANWLTILFRKKTYRTYTYGLKGYRQLLSQAGFEESKIDFYLGHPGYNLPQYIIPFSDLVALRFFLENMTRAKRFKGRLIRWLAKSDYFLLIARQFLFYSYLIYARK